MSVSSVSILIGREGNVNLCYQPAIPEFDNLHS